MGSQAPVNEYYVDYSGLILTVQRRFQGKWSLEGSYTWSRSEGLIPLPTVQNQGLPLYGSLQGSDPNEWLNAEQLLQNDRTHMFRLLGNCTLPWQLDATWSLNWQTGRPYARLAQVWLDQGLKEIIMDPASDGRRLPSSFLLDIGIGRRWTLAEGVVLKTDLQVLNLLNDDAVTYWETLVLQPGESLVPASWVWPRRGMIRLGLEF